MASNKDETENLISQANRHILADHYALTPEFIKDNSDELAEINEKIRKSLKYTDDDNPKRVYDRMQALQKITQDTYQSDHYGESLSSYATNKNSSMAMTDGGFKSIYSENEDREDMMLFNFHYSIFSAYRNLVSEYRNIARLIPEIYRGADMKARDILAINEITKDAVTNVYSTSSRTLDPTDETSADLAKNPVNKRINEDILEHYKVEDKLPRYFMTALIEGSKPIVVYPFKDIIEMAKFNINRYSTNYKDFNVREKNLNSSESYDNLLTEYCHRDKQLIPSFESIANKYYVKGTESLDMERSTESYVNKVIDMYISKEDQREYFQRGVEDVRDAIKKQEDTEITSIATNNNVNKLEIIGQTHEKYKDLIAKVRIDSDLEKQFKGQIFSAIKHIDDNVEFYNQTEAPMAMAINNLRRLTQFSEYSDKHGIGVTAKNVNLRKELVEKDSESRDFNRSTKKVKSVLDEFDDVFNENEKSLLNDCIIKEYDSEDVIPVVISGKHVGYYVVEVSPYTGNRESVNKRNSNFTDMFVNLGMSNDFALSPSASSAGAFSPGMGTGSAPVGGAADMSALGVAGAGTMGMAGGMNISGMDHGSIGDDALHRNNIMKKIIFNILQKKLQSEDINEDDNSFSDTIMSLIRDGAIIKNKVKIVYVPEKYMCYFTPGLDGNGIPQSFMKDCLFTCYEKILVNMNNIMTRLTRTGTKDKLTLNVGKAKNIGMSIRSIENALTTRKLNVESPFSSLSRVLKSASLSETIIEPIYDGEKLFEYEDISLNNGPVTQDDYEDKLTTQIITSLKCPVTITNPYQEEDFASLAASRNAEYRFDIIKLQKIFGVTTTKFVRLLILGSGLYDELKKGNDNISIRDFEVIFAPPEQLNMKNSNDMFGVVSSYIDNITEIVFNPDDDTAANSIAKYEFKKYMYQKMFPALGLDQYIQDAARIANTSKSQALQKKKTDTVNDFINNTKFEPLIANPDGSITTADNAGGGNDDDMGF